jgi:hypothetical protein
VAIAATRWHKLVRTKRDRPLGRVSAPSLSSCSRVSEELEAPLVALWIRDQSAVNLAIVGPYYYVYRNDPLLVGAAFKDECHTATASFDT